MKVIETRMMARWFAIRAAMAIAVSSSIAQDLGQSSLSLSRAVYRYPEQEGMRNYQPGFRVARDLP